MQIGAQTDKQYLTMDLDSSEMVKLHDEAYGHKDLHTQNTIKWDTEYPIVHELPVKKLVCVRAGMGVGKTIAIRNMLAKECTKNTKCYVSRSVVLSLQNCTATLRNQAVSESRLAKIVEEDTEVYTPEPLGFVNYQNHKGDLNFEDNGLILTLTPCDNI
jgi:hypothetical protein